jgi:hypothetical protein
MADCNYIHFEINGVSCNLIGSQQCDFSANCTPSSAIRAEIAPSFNQSHSSADFSQPIIFKTLDSNSQSILRKM